MTRSIRLLPVAAASIAALALTHAPARAEPPSGRDLERRLVALAELVVPRTAVVYGAIGLGSGAVVDREGTVVTNAHVALAARIAILEFADGRRVVARRRGIDFERDLAILEPEEPLKQPVPCFEMGRGRPETGTWVAAVGYPGGPRGDLRPTFSLGRVLAGGGLASPIAGALRYDDAIRTDIAIFEGNSGGPLVDLEGHLLGINGAFEPATANAFAIPLELVLDRLKTLRGGVIRWPGGREIDERNPVIAALGRGLDPFVKQLVERVHEGFDPNPKGTPATEPALPIDPADLETAREKTATLQRTSSRSKALGELLVPIEKRAHNVVAKLEGGFLATRISPRHLVAKASLLKKDDYAVEPRGKAHVIARSESNDLALLKLDEDADLRLPEDAGARPAGSIVAVVTPDVLSAGVVSVGARAIPEGVAARIAGAGLNGQLLRVIKQTKRLAARLGELGKLLETLEEQLELQRALGTGNDPRGYAHVLSHDAALLPSEAGSALVDLDGRLVGVNVASSNYGTSYVVPIKTIREAFASELGTKSVPERVGKAVLH